MKTQIRLMKKGLALSFLAASLLVSVGCAKKSEDSAASQPNTGASTPYTPRDADTDRGTDFVSGATAALTLDSMAALSAYAATHPVNNPQDVRISVKLKESASNQFSGEVFVSYYDNGQYYTGKFLTGEGQNPTGSTATSGTLYPGWNHAAYNNWFVQNGKAVLHGFFQDQYGAILLIADGALDMGDGSGSTELSGSIWFKNFANSSFQPTTQNIPCWFITAGPYDCRTFLVSGNNGDGHINSTSALYPTQSLYYTSTSRNPYIPAEPARGWRRLGTFSGLNKAKAFTQ